MMFRQVVLHAQGGVRSMDNQPALDSTCPDDCPCRDLCTCCGLLLVECVCTEECK